MVREVIDEISQTLSAALFRSRCTIKNEVREEVTISGNRSVLLLVLFNLVINSIEAQRSRRLPKETIISFWAVKESIQQLSRVVLHMSDVGPGIDRRNFPDPNTIFELGKSSKPGGTGRGLPISRQLISAFFGGSLVLLDPDEAHFMISIPTHELWEDSN